MKVKLQKPHTHAGTAHAPGDEIEVSDAQAVWLAEQGVIAGRMVPIAADDINTGKGTK